MQHSQFYRYIVHPQYRMWRHLCFILTLGIITFNQAFIIYQADAAYLGSNIYILCLAIFLTYFVITYVNYFILIPRFLLHERYHTYVSLLITSVFLLMFANIFLEYKIRTFLGLPHRIKSYSNPLIFVDSFSSSVITIICFWSMSAVELFRTWNQKTDQIISTEHALLVSEVHKLKGQVSPIFLSKALQKSSSIAHSHPEKSSRILMQLGQLLRYQLYDCDKEKVLLHSEINFINNFLQLHQLIDDGDFQFSLVVKGQTTHVLISPLLLIVVIQTLLEKRKLSDLTLRIVGLDKKITFDCDFSADYSLKESDIIDLTEKLHTLYPNLHQLKTAHGNLHLQLIF